MRLLVLPGMGATAEMYGEPWRSLAQASFLDWPAYGGETSVTELAKRIVADTVMTKEDAPGGFGALATTLSKNPFGPIAVMVDAQDRIWVSSLNDRVQAFSADDTFLFGTGKRGAGTGQFFRPHGMAKDSKGHLYVCDSSNHRVQKFRVADASGAER